MMIKEAWKRISRRLLEHGWKLPKNHTPETWPRFDVDTVGSAIPELEELVRNDEPHLGMITSPLKEAWKGISRRLLEHGWKLPNNHTPETWPRFDVDTFGSAIPELEELVRNGEPHLGMITSPLKDDLK